MSQNYYSTSDNYPSIFLPILERVQYLICEELLYPNEDYENPHPKFILAEQTDDAFRIASKKYRKTNFTIPFTVYNWGELPIDLDRVNANAKLGLYYADGYSSYIDATATVWNIPMLSVFNTMHDYMRAWTVLNSASIDNKKITVPCTVNNVSTSFDIYVTMDISRGPYAAELQEHERIGKINTIQHDLNIYFHNPILDTGIAPVDDIVLWFRNYSGDDYRDSVLVSSGIIPDTPTITSTIPVSGTIDISVSSDIILNFNVGMNEDITNDNIYVSPLFLFETTWNANATSVTIDPHDDLTSGTAYTITVYDDAESIDEVPLEEDYSFSFTTVES